MIAELTIILSLEFDHREEVKREIEIVCSDRFEEQANKRMSKEEYERIFRLLIEEVQKKD